MRISFRLSPRVWIFVPLGALALLAWLDWVRGQRVVYVSSLAGEQAVVDARSPTGYADGKRWLLVPEQESESFQWIAETQQMFAHGEWRVRRYDNDNAPLSREVHAASLYRWWLGLLAGGVHLVSGQSLAWSVERAALFADPLLQALLLLGTANFVRRHFGATAAAALTIGLATLYPLAGTFLPGAPTHRGLSLACALGSVLPLLAAIPAWIGARDPAAELEARGRVRRLFCAAGVAGGIGLWVSVADQAPVLIGLAVGAMAAVGVAARGRTDGRLENGEGTGPWRVWALGGAATSLAAYLLEYFPAHMEGRLEVNHPLYALAWIGVGEVLTRLWAWARHGRLVRGWGDVGVLLLAVLAIAAVPIGRTTLGTTGFLALDPLAGRLTSLPDGVAAENVGNWIQRDGVTGMMVVTSFPLLWIALAAWLLARQGTEAGSRAALVLALGPVIIALVLAWVRLRWWNMLDAVVLALLAPALAANAAAGRPHGWTWAWGSATAGVFLVGGIVLIVPVAASRRDVLTPVEVEGIIERDLAHWLALRAGSAGAVILAPPARTGSLCYYGGFRGVGSLNWENCDGLAAAIRIAGATSPEEVQALVRQRGLTHLILPSWDRGLEHLARLASGHPEQSLTAALRGWALPSWLRPVPYQPPRMAGCEEQSVVVFEVVDAQDRGAALSRLVEYFVDMEQLEMAAAAGQTLQQFPADLGALVALAQLAAAQDERGRFAELFDSIVATLGAGSDRVLPWDRRVSLAVVLAHGKRLDLARDQVRRCLAALTASRLRSLPASSLYRLQVLAQALQLEIADPRLRDLAGWLLPSETRQRLREPK